MFKILKKKKFVNSKLLVRSISEEINTLIENQMHKKLKLPFSGNIVNAFYYEFNSLRLKWKSLKGGLNKLIYLMETLISFFIQ